MSSAPPTAATRCGSKTSWASSRRSACAGWWATRRRRCGPPCRRCHRADDGRGGTASSDATTTLESSAALLARDECRLLTRHRAGRRRQEPPRQARRCAGCSRSFSDGAHWMPLDDLQHIAQVVARLAVELRLAPGAPQHAAGARRRAPSRRARCCWCSTTPSTGRAAAPDRAAARQRAAPARLRDLARAARRARRVAAAAARAGAAAGARGQPTRCWRRDAAQLFVVDGATSVRPDFDGAAKCRRSARLVRAIGGLPLAILLAANWVRLLPVAEILAELDALARRARSRRRRRGAARAPQRARDVRAIVAAADARASSDALAALSVFARQLLARGRARGRRRARCRCWPRLADKSLLQIDARRPLLAASADPPVRARDARCAGAAPRRRRGMRATSRAGWRSSSPPRWPPTRRRSTRSASTSRTAARRGAGRSRSVRPTRSPPARWR